MKKLLDLHFSKIIAAVSAADKPIRIKRGYFSQYPSAPTPKEDVLDAIHNAPFGAELYETDDGGELLVLIPTVSDMW